jgi:ubiquinone/menaquinone biosynthesis C-methylase UbiE
MLPRVLEPEVMDSREEASDYDAMDHSQVNRLFVADFLDLWNGAGAVLDVGTGTAQIPIELCRKHPAVHVVGTDLAAHMLELGRLNVDRAGLADRIRLEKVDAKAMPYADRAFLGVMSNSIVHHIPEPGRVLAEMVRVLEPGGVLFVRDLLRPGSDDAVRRLVQLYAGNENDHARAMFDASLRAALTLAEIRMLAAGLGFDPLTVRQTSDRHWTWAVHKPV